MSLTQEDKPATRVTLPAKHSYISVHIHESTVKVTAVHQLLHLLSHLISVRSSLMSSFVGKLSKMHSHSFLGLAPLAHTLISCTSSTAAQDHRSLLQVKKKHPMLLLSAVLQSELFSCRSLYPAPRPFYFKYLKKRSSQSVYPTAAQCRRMMAQ